MKPNILIISIDSLSHQRLFTQLKSAQTPNIDKLAKNGTTFEQSISSADGTELLHNTQFKNLLLNLSLNLILKIKPIFIS